MQRVELDTKGVKKLSDSLKNSNRFTSKSSYYFQGEKIHVITTEGRVQLRWLDTTSHHVYEFDEEEVLALIGIVDKKGTANINKTADIVMYVLCKKLCLNCISNLKNPSYHSAIIIYLQQLKQKEMYEYICTYAGISTMRGVETCIK